MGTTRISTAKVMAIAAVATILAGLAGCNTSKGDMPLIPDAKSPIADVPVPAGFTMEDRSTSKVLTGESVRHVDHYYKGSDDYLPVAKFYRDQLPTKGWTWVEQTQPGGKEVLLHFTKSSEDCNINIVRGTFSTEIHIRIEPIARAAK